MRYKVSLELKLRTYLERNERRYESLKRIGRHSMPTMDDEKGSRASGISTESDIRLNITR